MNARKYVAEAKVKMMWNQIALTSLDHPELDQVISAFLVQSIQVQYLKFPSSSPSKQPFWETVFRCGFSDDTTLTQTLFSSLRDG